MPVPSKIFLTLLYFFVYISTTNAVIDHSAVFRVEKNRSFCEQSRRNQDISELHTPRNPSVADGASDDRDPVIPSARPDEIGHWIPSE